jgi:putative addiction module killer protein
VYELQSTSTFDEWLKALRDNRAKGRILTRLDSARLGNLGDCRSLGGGLQEMRVFTGPGYRIYFAIRGKALIVVLCGGDKSSQARDIARTRQLLMYPESLPWQS